MKKQLYAIKGKISMAAVLREIAENLPPNMEIDMEEIVMDAHERASDQINDFFHGMEDALIEINREFCPECGAPVSNGKCSNPARHS